MKTQLLIIIVCLPIVASAQIQKGQSFLTGSISVTANKSSDRSDAVTQTYFRAAAMYGYLLNDSWAVGILPSYRIEFVKNPDKSKGHNTGYSIGPFVRKYFPIGEKLYLHVDLAYSYEAGKMWDESSTGQKGPVTKRASETIGLSPGASYFITDKIALQAILGSIQYVKYKDSQSIFDGNFGISGFGFGASVYF